MVTKKSLIAGFFIFILAYSCERTVVDSQPPGPVWQSLGLTGKGVQRVVLAEPFLYACLGDEGLWRLDLQASDTNWVYLGLADSSLGRQDTHGVEDVAISESNPDWFLAITQPLDVLAQGIFRSLDGGKTWLRAGSDLRYSTAGGFSGYFHPERFLQLGDVVYAAGQGFNVFRTTDFGANWETVVGGGPGLLDVRAFVSHGVFNDIVWVGGKTGFSREFFATSRDGLNTWSILDPIQNINRSGVNTIVLDPVDTSVVYAGLQNFESIKTTDAGKTWRVLFEQSAHVILLDPDDRSHLWMSSEDELWETRDAGATWTPIADIPTPIRVWDMRWDEKRRVVYMGASTGIFQYRP